MIRGVGAFEEFTRFFNAPRPIVRLTSKGYWSRLAYGYCRTRQCEMISDFWSIVTYLLTSCRLELECSIMLPLSLAYGLFPPSLFDVLTTPK